VHLVEAVREATEWDHTVFLTLVVPKVPALRRSLAAGANVIDVGCGSAEWDFRVAQAFPRARFLGLDPNSAALRRARDKARSLGLDDRVVLRRGSGQSMRFDARFDIAYLGEVLCAVAEPSRLLRNCRRALRPGGLVVVVEGLLDRTARSSEGTGRLLAAMDLEFALQGARFLSKTEIRDLLGRSGFVGIRIFDAGGGLSFVVARREGPHRSASGRA
jgi:SAM-dependent methyltransferase